MCWPMAKPSWRPRIWTCWWPMTWPPRILALPWRPTGCTSLHRGRQGGGSTLDEQTPGGPRHLGPGGQPAPGRPGMSFDPRGELALLTATWSAGPAWAFPWSRLIRIRWSAFWVWCYPPLPLRSGPPRQKQPSPPPSPTPPWTWKGPALSRSRRPWHNVRDAPCTRAAATSCSAGARARPALVLVGQKPEEQDDARGIPFGGPAGAASWRRILAALSLEGDQVYLTNLVKCRPSRQLAIPLPKKWPACRPFLEAQLKAMAPPG